MINRLLSIVIILVSISACSEQTTNLPPRTELVLASKTIYAVTETLSSTAQESLSALEGVDINLFSAVGDTVVDVEILFAQGTVSYTLTPLSVTTSRSNSINDTTASTRLTSTTPFFTIDNTGRIIVAEPLNFAQFESHQYQLMADDTFSSLTTTLTFLVSNLNDNPPVIESTNQFTILNNTPIFSDIGTVIAQDPDNLGSLTYSLSSTDTINIRPDGTLYLNNTFSSLTQLVSQTTLLVSDGGLVTAQALFIIIKRPNEFPPVVTSTPNITIPENTSLSISLGRVSVEDPDSEQFFFSFQTNNLLLPSPASSTGETALLLNQALDYETSSQHTLILFIADADGVNSTPVNITTTVITVNVTDVDDTPPYINPTTTFSVAENTTLPYAIEVLSLSDLDSTTDTLTLSFPSTSPFYLDASRTLWISESLDYELRTSYTGLALVSDGINTTQHLITLNIENLNDNLPIINSTSNFFVSESSPRNTFFGQIEARDPDNLAQLTYSLSPTISPINTDNNGTLLLLQQLDYETSTFHTFTLTVSDGFFSTTQLLTVHVSNVNDTAPMILSSTTFSVDENTTLNTFIDLIITNDPDGGEPVTYVLPSSAVFAVSSTGRLTLAGPLDYELSSIITTTITLSDGTNQSSSVLTVNIENLNDNEPEILFSSTILPESHTPGALIESGIGRDIDNLTALTYTLVPNDVLHVSEAGSLYLRSSAAFDYETIQQHTATLSLSDGLFSTSQLITIDVTDVNDSPPQISAISLSPVAENTTPSALIGSLILTDADENATFTLTTSPSDVIRISTDGMIYLVTELDYESTTQYDVLIRVSDGINLTTESVTLSVINLNDNTPTLIASATFSLSESSARATMIGQAQAQDLDDLAPLMFALTSTSVMSINATSGIIVLNSTLDYEATTMHHTILSVSDGEHNSTQKITLYVLNELDSPPLLLSSSTFQMAENASLNMIIDQIIATASDSLISTFTYSLNTTDTFTLDSSHTLRLNRPLDYEMSTVHTSLLTLANSQLTATYTLTLDVINLNDNAPSILSAASTRVAETLPLNSTLIQWVVSDPDTGINDAALTYTITPENLVSIDENSNTVRLARPLDYETTDTVIVHFHVSDGIFSTSQTFQINVDDANDSTPILTSSAQFSVLENTTIGTFIAQLSIDDSDSPASSLTATLQSTSVIFLSSSNSLYVNHLLDYETSAQYSVNIILSDGLLSSTIPLTINVVNLNDNVPSISTAAVFSFPENATLNETLTTIQAADLDNNALTFSISTDAQAFVIDANNGNLSINQFLDFESTAVYTFNITVSDGLFSSSRSITINITNEAVEPILQSTNTSTTVDTNINIPLVNTGYQSVTQCTSEPTLPVGFSLVLNSSATTCILQGAHNDELSTQTFIIKAFSNYGSTTAALTLLIKPIPTIILLNINNSSLTASTSLTIAWSAEQAGNTALLTHYWMQLTTGDSSANKNGGAPSVSQPSLSDSGWVALSNATNTIRISLTTQTDAMITSASYRTISAYVWMRNSVNIISEAAVSNIEQTPPILFNSTSTNQDPLMPYLWHLNNTGQANFGSVSGIAGFDINVAKTYSEYGYRGKDIIVSVLDTGLEIAHEDMIANVSTGSDDLDDGLGGDTDPSPSASSTGDHGTSVAGLIANRHHNGMGSIGVAPQATLLGYDLLSNQTFASYAIAFGSNTASPSNQADVLNLSFGVSQARVGSGSLLDNIYNDRLNNGRSGKGALLIKSAGNGFANATDHECDFANTHNASCSLAISDPSNTLPIVVVGAVTASGKKASYSSAGSNLWISGPAGEYGLAGTRLTQTNREMAMITADVQGCNAGYSRSDHSAGSLGVSFNDFEYEWSKVSVLLNGSIVQFVSTNAGSVAVGPHDDNTECNYTSTFNGTSAAAPVVSGVVALVLEANTALTHRDVKHILASTARSIDTTYNETTNYSAAGRTINLSQGWITNAAGFSHSDWYGFGLIDADRAVAMASTYSANSWPDIEVLSAQSSSYTLAASGAYNYDAPIAGIIPNNNDAGISHALNIADSLTIEHIEINLALSESLQDMAITLESPAGTTAMIYQPANGFNASSLNPTHRISTNAFYGENAQGNWSITIKDVLDTSDDANFDNTDGTFNWWKINVRGH